MLLEENSRKRASKQNVQRAILASIALAGALPLALMAPNVFGALGKMGLMPSRSEASSIARARRNLIEKGFIRVDDGHLELTKTGEVALAHFELAGHRLKKPRKWDRKWRVLVFDIPEKRRRARGSIRHSLSAVGFVKLQNSVWLYPYDCGEFVALLKTEFCVGRDLLYMIVDSLEGDLRYRKHFGLPAE